MGRLRIWLSDLTLVLILSCSLRCSWADAGTLVVHVSDPQDRPVRGLQIGLKSGGGTATTLDDGSARIPLAQGTNEHSFVSVQIVSSPRGADFVILSPYDFRVQVPSFENKPENYASVTVVQRSDRTALAGGKVIAAIAAAVNKANTPQSTGPVAGPVDFKANLEAVARHYGYNADEVDKAIRNWKPDPNDPLQLGQQALYEKNYRKATAEFQQALQRSEKQYREAAYFLGSSLLQEGRYEEAAAANQKCVDMDPLDVVCLNNEAVALKLGGHAKEALPLLASAVTLGAAEYGPGSLAVADYQANLGTVLEELGSYGAAEEMYGKALKVRQAKLGQSDPRVAELLNNMGGPLEARHDYAGAISNYESALEIYKNAGWQETVQAASAKNNLGIALRRQGRDAEAEKQFTEALQIDKKVLPQNHPEIAVVLDNLAGVVKRRGDRAQAETYYGESIGIKRKSLAPTSPSLARGLANLGVLLFEEKRYSEAAPLFREALDICKKAYVPPHRDIASNQYALALVLEGAGDFEGAEPLLREALSADLQLLGPNDPTTRRVGQSLQILQRKKEQQKQ